MNVLFVSRERPGRFGALASYLAKLPGWRCEFFCEEIAGPLPGVGLHSYKPEKARRNGPHFLNRHFDLQMRAAEAIYDAVRSSCRHTPHVVVDASSTGSSAALRALFDCPVVTYFPFFHQTGVAATTLRLRQQYSEEERLRLRTLNAAALLDLVNCDQGFTSTWFQHSLLPKEFAYKVQVNFEGCDATLFAPRSAPRKIGRKTIPATTRIVTFLSERLDLTGGFDTFLQAAAEIELRHPDVIFAVCGADVVTPDSDGKPMETMRQRFLREKKRVTSKFIFVGRLSDKDLADLLAITDVALYSSVPLGIDPLLVSAMAAGCVVLGSDTAPVREFIRHRQNGLLAGFFGASAIADEVSRVLEFPEQFRALGKAARAFVIRHLSMKTVVPKFRRLLQEAADHQPDQFIDEKLTIELPEEGGGAA